MQTVASPASPAVIDAASVTASAHPKPQGWWKRLTVTLAALAAVALAGVGLVATAPTASANTPSDYSHTYYVGASEYSQGQPVTFGWTADHAWVIASYSAVITAGSGQIASFVCNQEEGGLGMGCSQVVEQAVSALTDGHPAIDDHGIWLAYYLWPYHSDSGTW